MSLLHTKQLMSTSFSHNSSKIRNSALLNTSRFIRSTGSVFTSTPSFSQGNMTGKLSRLSEKLQQLNGELEMESLKVKEASRLCRQVQKRLNDALDNKSTRVKAISQDLQSMCNSIKSEETKRTQMLNGQCGELKESQRRMKDKFLKMKERIEGMESIMGYDSAIDRYIS